MAHSTPYLPDPSWEDQIAPRVWLSLYYVFRDAPSATATTPADVAHSTYQHLVDQLHANLEATLHHLPHFSARVVDDPRPSHEGRVRLVPGLGGLLHEWEKDDDEKLGVEDVVRILENADAAGSGPGTRLGLPRPWDRDRDDGTARVDVLRVREGVVVGFHAHHAVADMRALAVFAKCVAEGVDAGLFSSSSSSSSAGEAMMMGNQPHQQKESWDESSFNLAFKSTYFRLEDGGGPAQPETRHRNLRYDGKSRKYRVSRAKCKELLREEVTPPEDQDLPAGRDGCSLFAFLAAKLGAHALMARIDADTEPTGQVHDVGTLWIPVDVRDVIDKGGIRTVGNAVIPAVVTLGTEFWLDGSRGEKAWARRVTASVIQRITSQIALVRSLGYQRRRDASLRALAWGDPRGLGVRYDAAAGNWLQVNDSRRFGADTEFPGYGRAEAVRRHLPTAPGIVFHPVRAGDDALVLTMTLPEEAMEILQKHPGFLSFMESIKAAAADS
ncbi:uncharacterized protein PG986_004910 [Apiospora aurea]|uniref:Uncharacterized protein n=1 Tax=Apiospora aurea TaxID=335848 RepID=A0ABR1QG20_9PEZI